MGIRLQMMMTMMILKTKKNKRNLIQMLDSVGALLLWERLRLESTRMKMRVILTPMTMMRILGMKSRNLANLGNDKPKDAVKQETSRRETALADGTADDNPET